MELTTAEAWSVLVTFFSPYLISWINKPSWSSNVKRLVTVGVAAGIALITKLVEGAFTGGLDWSHLPNQLVLLVGAATTAYTALKAFSVTRATLDKTEAAASGMTPEQAVEAKAQVNAESEQEFKENVVGTAGP